MRKIGDLTVNDGNGLYDNSGLCDSLKVDLNNLLKSIASGQFIQMSGIVVQMSQKLENLKKGIAADLASKDEIIEDLKRMNNALVEEKTGLPVDRSESNGTD